jgi:hypothetical protein
MRARLLLSAAGLLAIGACETVPPPPPAPAAEFIVAASDSVFWIRSDADGIRVRGAPMVLAEVGGRFAELYVADDDQSFYDAVYVGQRLFKRDLITGDSMPLFADTLMRLLARGYAAANPEERPLGLAEQGSENPRTIASAEVFVIDVLGPWVSYEYRTDVDIVGGPSAHGSRRGVLDLRTGAASTLDLLFGPRATRDIVAEGRRQWRMLRDSIAAAGSNAPSLLAELDRLSFDPRSFILGVQERDLRVRFALAQSGSEIATGAHELFPIPVEPPVWWPGVAETQPMNGELGERVWERAGYTLVARPTEAPYARAAFAIRDAGDTEWRLGSLPSPVLRVMWLDDSAVAPGTQDALTRAFNDAALYSGDTRVVSQPRRPRAAPSPFRFASFVRQTPATPRRHPPSASRR